MIQAPVLLKLECLKILSYNIFSAKNKNIILITTAIKAKIVSIFLIYKTLMKFYRKEMKILMKIQRVRVEHISTTMNSRDFSMRWSKIKTIMVIKLKIIKINKSIIKSSRMNNLMAFIMQEMLKQMVCTYTMKVLFKNNML